MNQVGDESSGFFGTAERLRRELERLMERAKDQGERALDAFGLKGGLWHPAADIVETPDDVVVTLDLPGLSSEALSVEIAGNMLTVTGSRPECQACTGEIVHSRQRPAGKFTRSLPLPVPVKPEQILAEMHNGVLTVRMGKSERAKARKVPITEKP